MVWFYYPCLLFRIWYDRLYWPYLLWKFGTLVSEASVLYIVPHRQDNPSFTATLIGNLDGPKWLDTGSIIVLVFTLLFQTAHWDIFSFSCRISYSLLSPRCQISRCENYCFRSQCHDTTLAITNIFHHPSMNVMLHSQLVGIEFVGSFAATYVCTCTYNLWWLESKAIHL